MENRHTGKPKKKNNKRKLPQSALGFYIKLYCDRKGSSKTKYYNNLIEATKSWLSLSEAEKQQFHIKFKECKEKYKLHFFSQLKNAEPYMKIKSTSIRQVDSTIINLENTYHENQNEELPSETSIEQTEQIDTIEEATCGSEADDPPTFESPEHQNEQDENGVEAVENKNESPHTILIEPLPPAIKTGHELFCMLNSSNNTWASLPRIEKNRYSRAVSIMKKDYIFKYKEYLVSLTSKELFNHYNKNI